MIALDRHRRAQPFLTIMLKILKVAPLGASAQTNALRTRIASIGGILRFHHPLCRSSAQSRQNAMAQIVPTEKL
jgi:hypothetical protein